MQGKIMSWLGIWVNLKNARNLFQNYLRAHSLGAIQAILILVKE